MIRLAAAIILCRNDGSQGILYSSLLQVLCSCGLESISKPLQERHCLGWWGQLVVEVEFLSSITKVRIKGPRTHILVAELGVNSAMDPLLICSQLFSVLQKCLRLSISGWFPSLFLCAVMVLILIQWLGWGFGRLCGQFTCSVPHFESWVQIILWAIPQCPVLTLFSGSGTSFLGSPVVSRVCEFLLHHGASYLTGFKEEQCRYLSGWINLEL